MTRKTKPKPEQTPLYILWVLLQDGEWKQVEKGFGVEMAALLTLIHMQRQLSPFCCLRVSDWYLGGWEYDVDKGGKLVEWRMM